MQGTDYLLKEGQIKTCATNTLTGTEITQTPKKQIMNHTDSLKKFPASFIETVLNNRDHWR